MKRMKPLTRIAALLLATIMIFSVGAPAILAADGGWTVSADTEIYWVSTADSQNNYTALAEQVQLFASELKEKCGTTLPISYGPLDKAGANDIILKLDSASGIPEQGYEVTVSGTQVTVTASDDDGLFYGCRDLIKQLLLGGTVTTTGVSSPDVLERGMSLDNGRKYYSAVQIKQLIRELSWSNMNALVLHFSEEMGLGIKSQLYPWLAGRDGTLCTQAEVATDNTVLTQDEIKDIVAYAKRYHVEIIPSLDSPGHMNYIVKKFNEKCATEDYTFTYNGKSYTAEAGSEIGNYYHYNGTTSIVKGSRNAAYSRGIDISNEVAVAFTRSLIEEYATLFGELGCNKFDIGGDELLGWGTAIVSNVNKWQQLDHWKTYAQNRAQAEGKTNWTNAVAYDGFLYYMNDLYDLVTGLGYTSVRMWNDDALRSSDTGWNKVVTLNTNIDIWYWTTGSNDVNDYLSAGHNVLNIIGDYNYYAMTEDYYGNRNSGFNQAYADQIYNEWNPYVFDPTSTTLGSGDNTTAENPAVLGTALGVWCDNPTLKTADEVIADLLPMIHSHGAKAWDYQANSTVNYTTFTANWTKYGAAPAGTAAASDIYVVADTSALEAAVADYDSVNADMYTIESYAAYTAAVNEGKAVLAQEKPSQADVDAAVAAINQAFAGLKPPVPDDLLAAIEEYKQTDPTPYTPESFAGYTAAVAEAEELLTGNYSRVDLENAQKAIETAKSNLRLLSAHTGPKCFISGSFRSQKVCVGKVATLNMSIIKDKLSEVNEFAIYNDRGEKINIFSRDNSTLKSDRDNCRVMFNPTEADRGQRTYYVYAVYSDGTISQDYLELTLTVQ